MYEPEDFDRSLLECQEATGEEGVEIIFDANAPPPRGVSWHRNSDHWLATLRILYPLRVINVVYMVASGLILFFPAAVMILVGLKENNPGLFVAGFVINLLCLAAFSRFFVICKQLTVTREEAVGTIKFFGISLRRRAIALPKITHIYKIDQGLSSSVVLASLDTQLQVGELNKEAAAWLIRFASAAVTHINTTASRKNP